MSYNRYIEGSGNGFVELMPRFKYIPQYTDREEVWTVNKSRLDLISYKYYEDPNYDWLILAANEDIGCLEFEIPDGTTLIIPYPLEIALQQYNQQNKNFKEFYGFI